VSSSHRLHPPARRTEDEAAGQRDGDVVDTEVGEELRRGMELVRVPPALLEHAELGKPLPDEEVVADVVGARERPRDLGRPHDFGVDGAFGADRPAERYGQHRLVARVAIIGRDEARLAEEVAPLA